MNTTASLGNANPVRADGVVLNDADRMMLYRLAREMPDHNWADPALNEESRNYAKMVPPTQHGFSRRVLTSISKQYAERGYSLIRLGDFQDMYGDEAARRALVVLTSAVGKPFGAFHARGFFQTLGVNEDAKELRAESAGYIPFHMDFCQASRPPQGVALYCAQPDPNGGGENLLTDFMRVLKQADAGTIERILDTKMSYSYLFNTNNIGIEFNPHPLMEQRAGKDVIFRYNGKARPDVDAETQSLFDDLEWRFLAASEPVMLEQGDLLVINQRKMLHARQPLGGTREDRVDQSAQRLLWQNYIS